MTCQSVNPYAGKILKTFEEKTLQQRHTTLPSGQPWSQKAAAIYARFLAR
jgi:hypothetical protein